MTTDYSRFYATVGRQKTWEDNVNDAKVLPVSCTVIQVNDEMMVDFDSDNEDIESITGSWRFVAMSIKYGAGVSIDLSNIRAKGIVGRGGNISGGLTNFMPIYSAVINGTRQGRGGTKKGAGVLYLNSDHADLIDFLAMTTSELKHVKRAVVVKESLFSNENQNKLDAVLTALASGKIFLSKMEFNQKGERLYCNLCTETFMRSRGTCILGQVNLGQITEIEQIVPAFKYGMDRIIYSYNSSKSAIDHTGIYLYPDEDPQVGLGVIGLANMLVNFGVKYVDFVRQLEQEIYDYGADLTTKAGLLANALNCAYYYSGEIAKKAGLDRAFAIAPTASTSYRNIDVNGYTTTPEISPPVCLLKNKITRRQTSDGYQDYQYPPDVEVAGHDVDYKTYDMLVDVWQTMMDTTGLAHAISYNYWSSKPVNYEKLLEWFDSPKKSIYYRWNTDVESTDKTEADDLETDELTAFWNEDDYDEDQEYCEACAG